MRVVHSKLQKASQILQTLSMKYRFRNNCAAVYKYYYNANNNHEYFNKKRQQKKPPVFTEGFIM
jgi:hypothetical protein